MNRSPHRTANPGPWSRLVGHVPPGQFGRYLLVGTANTAFGYGSYALLTSVLVRHMALGYLPAALISSLLSITVAFLGYKWFVFKTKGNYLREWARCLTVYSGTILSGLLLLPILVTLVGGITRNPRAAPYIAGLLVTGLNVLISFFGHRNFSFR